MRDPQRSGRTASPLLMRSSCARRSQFTSNFNATSIALQAGFFLDPIRRMQSANSGKSGSRKSGHPRNRPRSRKRPDPSVGNFCRHGRLPSSSSTVQGRSISLPRSGRSGLPDLDLERHASGRVAWHRLAQRKLNSGPAWVDRTEAVRASPNACHRVPRRCNSEQSRARHAINTNTPGAYISTTTEGDLNVVVYSARPEPAEQSPKRCSSRLQERPDWSNRIRSNSNSEHIPA